MKEDDPFEDFGLTKAATLLGDRLYHGDDEYELVNGSFKKIRREGGAH